MVKLQNNLNTIYKKQAADFVRIQSSEIIQELRLFDSFGRLVLSQSNTQSQLALETSYLPSGMYNLSVTTNKNTYNRQLIIQH